jgi:hypothetical protein
LQENSYIVYHRFLLLEKFIKFVIIFKEVKKMQETGEIYLENILILSGKLENVRAIDITERMNFLSHRSGKMTLNNPAKVLRKRIDDELIGLLLQFKWWDKSIKEINALIPVLTCSNLKRVREELKKRLD